MYALDIEEDGEQNQKSNKKAHSSTPSPVGRLNIRADRKPKILINFILNTVLLRSQK